MVVVVEKVVYHPSRCQVPPPPPLPLVSVYVAHRLIASSHQLNTKGEHTRSTTVAFLSCCVQAPFGYCPSFKWLQTWSVASAGGQDAPIIVTTA